MRIINSRSFNQLSNLTEPDDSRPQLQFIHQFLPSGRADESEHVLFGGESTVEITLPPGLAGLTELNLAQNQLTSFTLPAGMTNLIELDLFFNQLTNLTLPDDLRNLGIA